MTQKETSDRKNSACFRTTIGGQALIEGIMMRGPKRQAIVVKTSEGLKEKVEDLKLIKERHPVLGWPFIRGMVNFFDSMVKGMQALSYSASLYEVEEGEEPEEPSKFEQWLEAKVGSEAAERFFIGFAVFLGIAFSVVLFILLPTILAGFFNALVDSFILRNLIEGALRIGIFLVYLWLMSRIRDIKRVFAYHGAEHKTIFCYEAGLELTVENVRRQSKHHPRCGTSFLFVVIVISILVFSFMQWSNVWVRIITRLLLLPVVVGISYEINRYVGRHDNPVTRVLTAPGLWLQGWTTNEPDDEMIEVGIASLKLVIPEEKGADAW